MAVARPSLLSAAQQAEVREMALRAHAESAHRGRGTIGGAWGRNCTELVRDFIADEYGVEMGIRAVQKMLVRLGLEYHHRAQGGYWAEQR
jgi:transposase